VVCVYVGCVCCVCVVCVVCVCVVCVLCVGCVCICVVCVCCVLCVRVCGGLCVYVCCVCVVCVVCVCVWCGVVCVCMVCVGCVCMYGVYVWCGVCVCVCACVCVRVHIVDISFQFQVSPGLEAPVIRPGDKCPYSLSHLASFMCLQLKLKKKVYKFTNFRALDIWGFVYFCHCILHIGMLRPTSSNSICMKYAETSFSVPSYINTQVCTHIHIDI